MTDFEELNLSTALEYLKKKELKSIELTEFFIDKITSNQNLNCFITKTFEAAIDQAKYSDQKLQNGQEVRPLEGIPIGMKDLFCTNGVTTTAGSKILHNFVPYY